MAELQAGALSQAAAMLGDASGTAPGRRLATLTEFMPRLVPDACGASAAVWDGGADPPFAASHPDLADLVAGQLRSGCGPVRTAAATRRPVRMPDHLHDDRWPCYRADALRAGIRASVTLPFARDRAVVVLTLYGLRPGGLDPGGPGELLGWMTADAIARDHHHRQAAAAAEQLDAALRTRPVVDQACGIVMYLTGCEAQEAFGVLRGISQRTNRKLADLASTIVETRRLPAGAVPG